MPICLSIAGRETMLEVEGLHAFYETSHVLFGIDLRVQDGEIVALVGRNGMGKTTIIRTIMGLLVPSQGIVRMDGKEVQNRPVYEAARSGLGLVPEGRQIFAALTTRENLVAMASNRNRAFNPWTLERIMELFPSLKSRQNNMGGSLSGGEQQMLAIGRALMTNPRLLMLDEATEGLAPQVRQKIWDCIRTLRRLKQAILIVDRNTDVIAEIADRLYILEKGRIVWTGTAAEYRAQRPRLEAYLGLPKAEAQIASS
jgi:branched-chain amino acid transport system ATP-binding protein